MGRRVCHFFLCFVSCSGSNGRHTCCRACSSAPLGVLHDDVKSAHFISVARAILLAPYPLAGRLSLWKSWRACGGALIGRHSACLESDLSFMLHDDAVNARCPRAFPSHKGGAAAHLCR